MSGPPAFKPTTTATRNVNLTIQTVAAVGSPVRPMPTGCRISSATHRVNRYGRPTGPFQPGDPRRRLPVRRRQGPAQPVHREGAGHDRGHDAGGRQDGQRLNGDQASHTFAVPELGMLVPLLGVAEDARTSADTRRARGATHIARSRSVSGLPGKGRYGGSASCPALPGGSSGTASRCRRSGTWTGSSMPRDRWSGAMTKAPRLRDGSGSSRWGER